MNPTALITSGCVAVATLALAACAGSGERPDAALARAQASINSAEQAGARQYGAADLDMARTKLTQARMLADDGENQTAQQLAEQAVVDAELAGARGMTGRSQEALQQVRASIESLQEEVNRPGAAMPREEGP
jgi:hypothetical protein